MRICSSDILFIFDHPGVTDTASRSYQKFGKGALTTINPAPLRRVLVRRCTPHLLLGSLNSRRVHTANALRLLKAQISRSRLITMSTHL